MTAIATALKEAPVLKDLEVSAELSSFVSKELLPGLDIDEGTYWSNFESIVGKYVEKNQHLLAKRATLHQEVRKTISVFYVILMMLGGGCGKLLAHFIYPIIPNCYCN